jgi:hypothetical protein
MPPLPGRKALIHNELRKPGGPKKQPLRRPGVVRRRGVPEDQGMLDTLGNAVRLARFAATTIRAMSP